MVVTESSSRYRDPALGPRRTTSDPAPPVSSIDSMATSSSTGSLGWAGKKVMATGSDGDDSNTAPHDEQKLAPSGFLCPQLLQ